MVLYGLPYEPNQLVRQAMSHVDEEDVELAKIIRSEQRDRMCTFHKLVQFSGVKLQAAAILYKMEEEVSAEA